MSHSYCAMYGHLVFSTKRRKRWLHKDWREDLWARFGEVAGEKGLVLLSAGGIEDHVHLLLSMTRTIRACDMVQALKVNTTQWCRTRGENPAFEWQDGYALFSVSKSGLPRVRDYILDQEARHARRTFKQELRLMLDKQEIKYDPETMWD